MSRRSASGGGKRIGAGRLRVDAGRAVAKLREYQLPDPTAWVLEVVRAAVAKEAKRVRVFGDADDLWIGWEGPPPEEAHLTELLHELVSPAPEEARRWLRLMAIGVNTALGLGPRFVDVYRVPAEGLATRVRYTPELLEPKGDEGVALRGLATERVPAPNDLPAPGGAVHVRRKPSFDVVRRFLAADWLPELPLVRAACDDCRVPVEVLGDTLERGRSRRDLVRVQLGLGLDGFVAITDPRAAPGEAGLLVELAEQGVVLARLVLSLEGSPAERLRSPLPIRVYLDADRLPANASRSAVRQSEAPVRDALAQGAKVLPAAIAELAEKLQDDAHADDHDALRRAALALVSAHVAGVDWATRLTSLPAWLEPLRDVPLVRNAVGAARPVQAFVGAGELIVHRRDVPVEEALAPWFEHVLWVPPGDPAGRLLGDARPPGTKERVKLAREEREAYETWLAHAPREARVPEAAGQLLALRFGEDVKTGRTQVHTSATERPGLQGELCLLDPASVGRRRGDVGNVTLLLQGRPIASAQLAAPWPWEAVIDAPDLRPLSDYQGAIQDSAYHATIAAVRAAELQALELVAAQLEKPEQRLPARATIRGALPHAGAPGDDARRRLRRAQRALVELLHGLAPTPAQAREVFRQGPLGWARVWPRRTAEGVRFVALRDLQRDAGEWLVVTPPEAAALPPPHGVEPVLADGADRQVLATVLRGVELLPYDPRRGREIDLGGLAARAGAEGMVSLLVDEGPRVGVLTWIHGGGKSRLALRHRGLLLARTPYEPELVDCVLTVEDDGLIPDADWRAPAIDWEAPEIGEWERRMVTAIVDALRGEETEDVRGLVHAGELDVPPIRRLLLIAISRWEGASRALGEARWKALLERPLIERLGAPPASLLDVTEHRLSVLRPGQVTRAERFEGFQPLIADEALENAIAKILRRRLPDGTEELERRRMEAVREANLARHRRRGARPLPEAGGEVVAISGAGFSGVVQPQRGLLSSTFSIEVRFEERPLEKLSSAAEMPLAAVVNVDERHLDPTGAGLDPASQKTLEGAVHRAAGRVLLAIAEDDPAKLVDDSVSASLFDVWLRERAHRRGARQARRKLAEAKIFRTVQGGRASLEEASTKARIRVARFDAEWVGPPEGEERHHLDRPILQLPEGDAGERLRDALDRFGHPRICLDQTRAVRTLQGERRVHQGLVEEPKLSGIDPRLSASVEELLGDRRRLRGIGPGEVGLTKTGGAASLTVFGASERTAEVELELDLPVRAVMTIPALGADDIDAKRVRYLSRRVRELVQTLLVEKVLPELDALPAWVREVARGALLQELLTPDEVGDAALFETTGDARVSLGRLKAQARRFGALWVATDPGWRAQRLEPLDPKRIALRGNAETVEALRALGLDAVAADEELALDERARRNQAQGKARSLALPLWTRSRALARTTLEEKEWRAELALLEPEASDRGGLRFFRELHPLGGEGSPGPWPIYAHVDAPGLVPDRTWEGPKPSKLLERIRARLVDEAAEALAELVPEPEGALATFVVHPERAAGAMGAGTAAGVLAVGPLEPGTIDVPQGFHGGVLRPDVQPPEGGPKEPLPVYGTLLACVDAAHAPGLRLQHAARTAYTAMMAELARRLRTGELEGADAELARGHLVRAIGLGAWKPQGKAKKIEVPCFHPEPKALGEVYALLREETRNVAVRDPADAAGTKHCLVEDGSDAARELVAALGDRVRRKRVEPLVTEAGVEAAGAEQMERFMKGEISLAGLMGRRAEASEGAKKGRSKSKSKSKRKKASAPARKRHPLDPLAETLLAQLAALGLPHVVGAIVVVPRRRKDLLRYDEERKVLELSGAHPQLKALEAARLSRSADAERGMRLLTAHAVGILNRALTTVTDASEHGAVRALMRA